MIDHISPSQINMYLGCSRQWYYRYVEGLRIPPGAALIRGSAVHAGAEHNYVQKITSKIDLPRDEVIAATVAYVEREDEERDWSDASRDEVKDDAARLVGAYMEIVAPTVQPVLVEETFSFSLLDTTMTGRIDVFAENGVLRDIKTASRAPNQDEVEKSMQLACYTHALRRMGHPVTGCALDYLVQGKGKALPRVVTLSGRKTSDDVSTFLAVAEDVVVSIQREGWTRNPTSWKCTPKWCGYYSRCMGSAKYF